MKYLLLMSIGTFLVLTACQDSENGTRHPAPVELDTFVLALDWSPNVLHAGILYADLKGWFDSAGIALQWYSTEIDNYTKKPIMRVLDGEADLAIGPVEHIVFYGTDSAGNALIRAIGSLLHSDQSAYAVKAASGIERPAMLTGKTYIGYRTPLEEAILATMIVHDGGKATFRTLTPPRLSVWDAFIADSGDVAWIFTHWEGIIAGQQGIALRYFRPAEYGVPYGYSSVLFAPAVPDNRQKRLFPKFLKVAERGYRAVAASPQGASLSLCESIDHSNFNDPEFISLALNDIIPAFFDSKGRFGFMQAESFEKYLYWMANQEFPGHFLQAGDLFTNEYLHH